MYRLEIVPQGCTHVYASPQQLRSLQLQIELDSSNSCSSAPDSTPSVHVTEQHQQLALDPLSRGFLLKVTGGTAGRYQNRRLRLQRRACWPCWRTPKVVEEQEDIRSPATQEESMYIDGRRADIFAAGVILYELVSLPAVQQ